MIEHLPVLLVVTPLLAAPLCLLLRHAGAVRGLSLAAVAGSLAMAILLLRRVLAEGTISYHLGGWKPPLGIEYRIDLLNAYVLLVVTAIATVVLLYGRPLIALNIPQGREYLYHSLLLLAVAGLLGIAATGDAFNVFVFLEISSLASYSLIALGRRRRALMAAYSYLIVGTIGGTFVLIGIGLMYQMTGTLNMADLAERLPAVIGTRTVLMAFAFSFVGISIKLAVFPLHQWLPNAYTYAPAVVSALIAATATKVSYYLLVRVIFTIFGAAFVFGTLHLDRLLVPLSLLAMFVGSIAAIYQLNVKRLLAYSSIAQIGYMTLGLSFASVTGLTGGLVHLFNHALMKGGLFLVAASVICRTGGSTLDKWRGLGRRMPLTCAAFVVGGLALIGVPGTAGFISKWYLVLAALEKGWTGVAFLIVFSSLLAVVYVWKVVEVAYFQPAPTRGEPVSEVPASMWVPTWILIGATLYFGFSTRLTAGLAEAAARQLLGIGP